MHPHHVHPHRCSYYRYATYVGHTYKYHLTGCRYWRPVLPVCHEAVCPSSEGPVSGKKRGGHTHTHTCTCTHTDTHTRTHTYIHKCTHTLIHMRACAHTHSRSSPHSPLYLPCEAQSVDGCTLQSRHNGYHPVVVVQVLELLQVKH